MMTQPYPIFLRLDKQKCLVIGGGKVAERKVKSLLQAGANVVVVSPQLTPGLTHFKEQGKIKHIAREYQPQDLSEAFVAICATDNKELNGQVADQCRKRNILVNVVNDPPKSNFFVPATMQRGSLSIAISTNGKSPLLAAHIREQLEQTYGPEYADFLELLGQVRQDVLHNVPDSHRRKRIMEKIIQSDIIKLLREKRYDKIKERIQHAYHSSGS